MKKFLISRKSSFSHLFDSIFFFENTIMHHIHDPNTLENPSQMFDWVLNVALVLSHSYVIHNIAFNFIPTAFKKGIDEFVCSLSCLIVPEYFLYPFPIPFFSLFLCIPPKRSCITRILMNYSISGSSTFMHNNASIFSSQIYYNTEQISKVLS